MAPHILRSYYYSEDAKRRFQEKTITEKTYTTLGSFESTPQEKKTEFLKALGLRTKRLFESDTEEDTPRKKMKTRDSSHIKLRECSVVILGEKCKLCGKDFKCSTDLVSHMQNRHCVYQELENSNNYLNHTSKFNAWRTSDSSGEEATCDTNIRSKKLQKRRLRLILKMGCEIVGDLLIKRKHLNVNTTDASIQTNTQEVEDSHRNVEMCIDPPTFSNDARTCITRSFPVTKYHDEYPNRGVPKNTATKSTQIYERGTGLKSFPSENNNKSKMDNTIDLSTSGAPVLGEPLDSQDPKSAETDLNNNNVDSFSNKEFQPLGLKEVMNTHSNGNVRNASSNIEHQSISVGDDDVQEVLRISRRKNKSDVDINHESPNRVEREILHLFDAIKSMLQMENRGYHLLGECETQKENVPTVPTQINVDLEESKRHELYYCNDEASKISKKTDKASYFTWNSLKPRELETGRNSDSVILIDLVDDD